MLEPHVSARRPPALLVLALGLAAFFGAGFLRAFLSDPLRWLLTITCFALALGVLATIAWVARTQWGAALASAAFVPLALLSLGYGIYFARETGWHGLLPMGRATSDHTGTNVIWYPFIVGAGFWLLPAMVASVAVAWANASWRHEA